MNPQALLALVSLIQQITSTALALQSISAMIQTRQAMGQDVTLDDLKLIQLEDSLAAANLLAAIEEAERG